MKSEKPTIKEIALKTGVSIGSVHRAIYGKPGLSEETRKRILEEVERVNYRVDEAASTLKRKTLNIAVVLPRPEEEERFFFRGIWSGVREAAEDLDHYKVNFIYIESEYHLSQISMALQKLYDTALDDIDGLITISDCNDSNEWIARFYKQGVTVVLISSYGRTENCFCTIKVDHRKAGKLAAEYISKLTGALEKKVLVLTGDGDIFSNLNYSNGFLEEMSALHLEEKVITLKGFGSGQITEQTRALLESGEISAVFACNARNTYAVCEMMMQMQPAAREIRFVGTDAFYELKPFFDTGILDASIYQYNKEQGRKAVEVLVRYLANGSRERGAVNTPIGLILKNNYEYYIN